MKFKSYIYSYEIVDSLTKFNATKGEKIFTLTDAHILSCIKQLHDAGLECTYSNADFESFLHLTRMTIISSINTLVKYGLINREVLNYNTRILTYNENNVIISNKDTLAGFRINQTLLSRHGVYHELTIQQFSVLFFIKSLGRTDKGCIATNNAIAQKLMLNQWSISRILKQLEEEQLIKMYYSDNNRFRKIYYNKKRMIEAVSQ